MFTKKIKKVVWLVLLLLLGFAVVTYVGNVLTIGEKIGNITCTLVEVLVDVLLIFGPIAAVIWKIRKDVFKYKFVCLDKITAENVTREQMDDFLNGVKENCTQDEISSNLKSALQAIAMNDKKIYVKNYLEECEKKSAAAGREIALIAALSVVVSPKRMTDTLGMLFWNFRIINEVLKIYGVRPSGFALIKLYCYVLFSSLVVGSIEEIMEHFEPPQMKKIPFLSPISQAITALYACLKTVSLTQYYLKHGLPCDEENRKKALKTARIYAKENLFSVFEDNDFKNNRDKVIKQGLSFGKELLKDLLSQLQITIGFGNAKKDAETDVTQV